MMVEWRKEPHRPLTRPGPHEQTVAKIPIETLDLFHSMSPQSWSTRSLAEEELETFTARRKRR